MNDPIVNKFREIWLDEFNEELSESDAAEKLRELSNLIKMVCFCESD